MNDGLISISEAASLLHRKVDTVRRWERRGYASTGQNLRAEYRDAATNVRYFNRARILEIRAALMGLQTAS